MNHSLLKIFTTFIITLNTCLVAVGKEDHEAQFNKGKQLFLQTKYAEAMSTFMPLTQESKGNKYVEVSQYYYALSAFKDKKMQDAYYMLLQLTQKYSKWDNIEEAYYLAGAVSFELKKYRYGLNFLKDRNQKLETDINAMKAYYLSKVQPLDTIIALQKAYIKDFTIAQVLSTRLQQTKPINEKQNMLLQYLVQEYKVVINTPSKATSDIKATYNVAALFPLMVGAGDFDSYTKNNSYITDLYLGMKEALDTLKKEGIDINLYAYDTEKDNNKLATLLQNPELRNLDLIVGPLLPNQGAAVSAYAKQNMVSVLNPISNNSKLCDNNEFVYLFQPSLQAQAGQAAQLVKKKWVTKDKTKAAIYYGESARDSLLAKYYKDSLMAQKISVPIFEKLKKDKLYKLSSTLSDSNKLRGYTHIFVASNEEIIAATVISALEKSMNSIPVITRAEWLQLPSLGFEQLQKRNIHFIYPEFIDYFNNPLVKQFKENFAINYHSLPSQYVYMGYDLMYTFAHVMKENGNNLKMAFSKPSKMKGIFMPNFNFTNSNTNLYMPIVKFEDMQLKVVNPLE